MIDKEMKMRKLTWMGLLILAAMILAACTPVPTAVPTALPTATNTETLAPTETLVPTDTPVPTATNTPTLTPTITLTPTATPDYSVIQVIWQESYANRQPIVALKIPGITEAYGAKINNVAYTCSIDANTPDTLFCNGPLLPYFTYVQLALYHPGDSLPFYEATIPGPVRALPTATPVGNPNTWCTDRGQNVNCETENRTYPGGVQCVVSTCFDACGYYYSVDTCPTTTPNP